MGFVATRLGWTSPAKWFAFFGFNSALVYLLIFLLPYQLSQYYTMPLPWLYSFQNASPQLLLVGWIILFQLYYIGYRLCPARPTRVVMSLIVCFSVFFSLILFFMYPIGANDIYEQIFRGHTFAYLGAIPMETIPDAFPQDPLLKYVWWHTSPGTYGPLWELTSAGVSWLVGTNLWKLLVAYKLLASVHLWGSMLLVYLILRRIRPEFAMRGFLLFAWNPLVQFEMAGNSHNDTLLVFWMLMAIYLLVRGRHILSLVALTAAVLIKFLPILLIPLFLTALWKAHSDEPLGRRSRHVALALAAVGVFTAVVLLPFKGPSSTLAVLSLMNTYIHCSVQWIVFHTFQTLGIGGSNPRQLVDLIFKVFTVIVVLWHTVRLLRGSSDATELRDNVLRGSFEIMFAYLLIGTQWLNPWYITWLFAFVPFLPRFGYAERAILFCFTVLASYFIWFYRWPIGTPIGEDAEVMLFWVIFPLPFLLSIGLWLYESRGFIRRPARKHIIVAVDSPRG